jgi:hypothetical protein
MMRFIATICTALLLAAAAAAGDPGEDAARALEAREEARAASASAGLENQTEMALRHHKAVAEASLKIADCRGAIDSAEAQALSASERHRRLIDCFEKQRANDALIAVNPE